MKKMKTFGGVWSQSRISKFFQQTFFKKTKKLTAPIRQNQVSNPFFQKLWK